MFKHFSLPFEETAGVHSVVRAPDGMVYFRSLREQAVPAKLESQHGKDYRISDVLQIA